jgi:hypothetical protein
LIRIKSKRGAADRGQHGEAARPVAPKLALGQFETTFHLDRRARHGRSSHYIECQRDQKAQNDVIGNLHSSDRAKLIEAKVLEVENR